MPYFVEECETCAAGGLDIEHLANIVAKGRLEGLSRSCLKVFYAGHQDFNDVRFLKEAQAVGFLAEDPFEGDPRFESPLMQRRVINCQLGEGFATTQVQQVSR